MSNHVDAGYTPLAVITKSDTSPPDSKVESFRALWVGGAGNISVRTTEGTDVLFSGIAAGTVLPVRGVRVNSTNTTATLIVGLG